MTKDEFPPENWLPSAIWAARLIVNPSNAVGGIGVNFVAGVAAVV
jgi:hypothetical protein